MTKDRTRCRTESARDTGFCLDFGKQLASFVYGVVISMILMVTRHNSPHAKLVEENLRENRARYIRLNVDNFLTDYKITWLSKGEGSIEMDSGYICKLSQINAVWWYDFPMPKISGLNIDRKYAEWAKYETSNGLFWALATIDAYFMSRPDKIDFAHTKSIQMIAAAKRGFALPDTILSNDPASVRRFVKKQGSCVFKAIAPISREKDLKTRGILTSKVAQGDLDNASMRVKMNFFQRYIDKEYELRAIVVGDRCFSVKIESQLSEQTKVDWRRYDIPNTPHWSYRLPRSIEEKCVRLVHDLELEYSAIDLIRGKDNKYYFLELNPVGLWAWLEVLTDSPISKAIAERLIDMDKKQGG